jgi:Lrp/AsnC family leucine-responsive transcriptional regulator
VKILARGIDDVDKRILHLLSENPEISQIDIAKRLRISQPAVSARIKNLREKGVMEHLIGIDVKKAQLFLAKIDVVTANTEQVLDSLSKCPLYLNGFLTSGKYNLTILLIGENMRSIVSCVDSHLRPDPIIKEMEFNLVVTPVREFVVPVKPILDKKRITPCGKDCGSCKFYVNNRCLGCAASIHYRGTVL